MSFFGLSGSCCGFVMPEQELERLDECRWVDHFLVFIIKRAQCSGRPPRLPRGGFSCFKQDYSVLLSRRSEPQQLPHSPFLCTRSCYTAHNITHSDPAGPPS